VTSATAYLSALSAPSALQFGEDQRLTFLNLVFWVFLGVSAVRRS